MRRRKPLTKKQRLVVTIASLTLATTVLAVGYTVLINEVLLDYSNMSYIQFSYSQDNPNYIRIDKVYENSNYPSEFRIPKRLLGKAVTEISNNAFENLNRLVKVEFPDTITKIGDYAFYNCQNLKYINIPKNLKHVGIDAFHETKYLNTKPDGPVYLGKILYTYNGELESNTAIVPNRDVNVPGAEHYIYLDDFYQIGSGAFKNKQNLIYVEYTNKFDQITQYTFEDCRNLETVKLADNTKLIGKYAFSGCTSLSNLDLNTVNGLESIGDYAFSNTAISGEIVLSDSIKNLGEGAFANTGELDKVTLPKDIVQIPKSLFENSGISSVVFQNEDNATKTTITRIGNGAFKNTKLTSFKLPYAVKTINESLFEGCSELETVYLYENSTGTDRPVEVITYDEDGNEVVDIANEKHGVTKINTRAFANTPKLKGVVLLDKDGNEVSANNEVSFPTSTIENVEKEAFKASGLTKVNIPSNLYKLESGAFLNCTSLTNINFYKVGDDKKIEFKKIDSNTFEGCTSLVSVTIPNYVEQINAGVFKNCTSLEEINFEEGISFPLIGASLFEGCTALEHITLPRSVITIQEKAFANSGLKNLVLNKEIINLGAYIFQGCSKDLVIFAEKEITVGTKVSKNWNLDSDGVAFKTAIYSEEEPTLIGTYWHYVAGVPTLW